MLKDIYHLAKTLKKKKIILAYYLREMPYWSSPDHWNSATSDPVRHGYHEQSKHAWKVSNDSGNVLLLTQHLQLLLRKRTWEAETPKFR